MSKKVYGSPSTLASLNKPVYLWAEVSATVDTYVLKKPVSIASAALLLAITINGSFTVSVVVLTVIVSPVTVKSPDTVISPGTVIASPESPRLTAFSGKPACKTVFKFAAETETSVFTFAPSVTLSIASASVFDKAFGTPALAAVLPIKVSVAIFASLAIVTAAVAIVVDLLLEVTSPVKFPILVTVPAEPETLV